MDENQLLKIFIVVATLDVIFFLQFSVFRFVLFVGWTVTMERTADLNPWSVLIFRNVCACNFVLVS